MSISYYKNRIKRLNRHIQANLDLLEYCINQLKKGKFGQTKNTKRFLKEHEDYNKKYYKRHKKLKIEGEKI